MPRISMSRARDTQRAKVYRAIKRVKTPDAGENLKQISRWVQNRLLLQAVAKRYPSAGTLSDFLRAGRVSILPGRPTTFPNECTKLAKYSYAQHKVLAQMAYHMHLYEKRLPATADGKRDKNAAWHSWQYCAIYMDLVRYIIGKAAADDLKAAFKAEGVRWKVPRQAKAPTAKQLAALKHFNKERDAALIDARWDRFKATGRKRELDL